MNTTRLAYSHANSNMILTLC